MPLLFCVCYTGLLSCYINEEFHVSYWKQKDMKHARKAKREKVRNFASEKVSKKFYSIKLITNRLIIS